MYVVQGAGFRVSVKSSANNREQMEVAEPEGFEPSIRLFNRITV